MPKPLQEMPMTKILSQSSSPCWKQCDYVRTVEWVWLQSSHGDVCVSVRKTSRRLATDDILAYLVSRLWLAQNTFRLLQSVQAFRYTANWSSWSEIWISETFRPELSSRMVMCLWYGSTAVILTPLHSNVSGIYERKSVMFNMPHPVAAVIRCF